jgi:hypothetical protein
MLSVNDSSAVRVDLPLFSTCAQRAEHQATADHQAPVGGDGKHEGYISPLRITREDRPLVCAWAYHSVLVLSIFPN